MAAEWKMTTENIWAETWDPTLPSDLNYKSKWERQGSTVVDHVTIFDISSASNIWSAVDYLNAFFLLFLEPGGSLRLPYLDRTDTLRSL
ncbi:hypothetical protein ElyMa_001257200 [Elysia marginata]|uniref:Uncharacterized protein n=1 Tax=Elysia marginata TaxID=1093978 RepID=A0AAV4IBB7_9GAST|nr:hypothetical protein ElyMa_001257200 [Elysia marginata]